MRHTRANKPSATLASMAVTLLASMLLVVPVDIQADEHEESKKDAEEEKATLPEDPLGLPRMPHTAPGMTGLFGDNYWYLPYAISEESEGLAFVDAYRDILEAGKKPPERLEVGEGKGAGGGDYLYRLAPGVTDHFISDINNIAATAVPTSDVPVIIAQPKPHESGANVLFLDGHIDFVQRGTFPLTEDFLRALKKLDPPEYAEEDSES